MRAFSHFRGNNILKYTLVDNRKIEGLFLELLQLFWHIESLMLLL
tara:strand:- start:7384 stop:7518 length:135 start_codon:yes stop_codon:yes gene_type:complete